MHSVLSTLDVTDKDKRRSMELRRKATHTYLSFKASQIWLTRYKFSDKEGLILVMCERVKSTHHFECCMCPLCVIKEMYGLLLRWDNACYFLRY